AAKERGGKIPIVVINSGDPVATGLAASLAHPGSNITGVSEIATELSAKRLALLKQAVPSVRAVAVLWHADDFGMTVVYQRADVLRPGRGGDRRPRRRTCRSHPEGRQSRRPAARTAVAFPAGGQFPDREDARPDDSGSDPGARRRCGRMSVPDAPAANRPR